MATPPGQQMLNGRYEMVRTLSVRGALTRHWAMDHGTGGEPVPVVVVQMPYPQPQIEALSGSEDVLATDPLVQAVDDHIPPFERTRFCP